MNIIDPKTDQCGKPHLIHYCDILHYPIEIVFSQKVRNPSDTPRIYHNDIVFFKQYTMVYCLERFPEIYKQIPIVK